MAATNRARENRALYQVADWASGVNWRLTQFTDERTLNLYACCVCHVVPNRTVVLPCSHSVCPQCQVKCVGEDDRWICPMDGEPFSEEESQELRFPARRRRNLKAYCWNHPFGCDFVAPLMDVLKHYEQECIFHVSPCEWCGEVVLCDVLALHRFSHCRRRPLNLRENPLPNDIATIASPDTSLCDSGSEEELKRVFGEEALSEAMSRTVDNLERMVGAIDACLEKGEEHVNSLEGGRS